MMWQETAVVLAERSLKDWSTIIVASLDSDQDTGQYEVGKVSIQRRL